MTSALEWVDLHADRILAVQRAQVETAKLLTTFSSGVAATVVATALQVGASATTQERAAVWVLGASVAIIALVVLTDRIGVADHEALQIEAYQQRWDAARFEFELRVASLASVESNVVFVKACKVLAAVQLGTAFVSGSLAAASLLHGS